MPGTYFILFKVVNVLLIAWGWQLFQERRPLKRRYDRWELHLFAEVSELQTHRFPLKSHSGPFRFNCGILESKAYDLLDQSGQFNLV